MTRRKKKRKSNTSFHNLDFLTYGKLMKMDFLEFSGRIWLVFDPLSKSYLALDGHTNQSYYSSSFYRVERQFKKLEKYYKKINQKASQNS